MSNLPGLPLANSFHRRRDSSKPTSIKSTASSYDRDGIEITTVGGTDGDLDGAVPLELVSSLSQAVTRPSLKGRELCVKLEIHEKPKSLSFASCNQFTTPTHCLHHQIKSLSTLRSLPRPEPILVSLLLPFPTLLSLQLQPPARTLSPVTPVTLPSRRTTLLTK